MSKENRTENSMSRIIKPMEQKYLFSSLNLVEDVFAKWDSPEEGRVVRKKANDLGFQAVLVEGDPKNYHPRGFMPSYQFGIKAGPNIQLPHPDCLMVKELQKGALDHMSGLVDYSFYETLHSQ